MARTSKSSKSKKKIKLSEMSGEDDPRAPLDSAALLAAATPLLKRLEVDLRARITASPAVQRALEARWEKEKKEERTAESLAAWSAALATQVAAAWLLSCVFVRTLEDRGLLRQARLAGPGALDSQKLFFQLAPSLTERDYLLMVFRELSRYPAARDLFDAEHSLAWKLSPSAELAKELLALFRTPNAESPTFRFGQVSTRFLGDLYQDLSEDVRKRYALLQTPDFIESFILDRTLEPAIERFGLDDTTLIDPTCGSGHFLLGAFDRLFDHRLKKEPGVDVRVAAQRALDSVYGADINPYAVAIARFRLTLAYLEKAGYSKLADAPALPLHVVVADSLLHNPHQAQTEMGHLSGQSAAAWGGDAFALEDEVAARAVLHRQYAAVVGNPPYITEKDPKRREVYRRMYVSAAGKYALSAPFCERFFQLARERGHVGQITANSFMKREFGKQLIETYLATVNLDLLVNTSGAYVPGHGTPTVLLFGTHEPQSGNNVLAVLAKRGEPSTPEDPARGEVWASISAHWADVGFENEYVSVARMDVAGLRTHPWSLGGGGAGELKALLEERAKSQLGELVEDIGFASFTGLDDAFILPSSAARTLGIESELLRPMAIGENIRDWSCQAGDVAITPYAHGTNEPLPYKPDSTWGRLLWRYRTVANNVASFGGKTRGQEGQDWWSWYRWQAKRYCAPFRIAFAFVATHNHFVLDRGGRVFNRSAPIIKQPEGTSEDDHLALLAYLNSSTACFWMKQVFHRKSSASQKHHTDPARAAYEFAGTGLKDLPVPSKTAELSALAVAILEVAGSRSAWMSGDGFRSSLSAVKSVDELRRMLEQGWRAYDEHTRRAAYLQEELDWHVYGLFGLCEADAAKVSLDDQGLGVLGARPFEVDTGYDAGLSDRVRGETVRATNSETTRTRWDRRRALLKDELGLLEAREYKRMWRDTEQNVDQSEFRLGRVHTWVEELLLDQSETYVVQPEVRRISDLWGRSRQDIQVAIEYLGHESMPFLREVIERVAVPCLAASRYSESGLLKYGEWTEAWQAQRAEDGGLVVKAHIPPKYEQEDFERSTFWQLRGKLDVPKERFISYPGCESDEDGEPVYGWAGWNHLQRAQALASLYMKRKDGEAWAKERLTPMLAGLLELIPWVKQWHNEPSEEFQGLRMGEYFEQFLDGECRQLGLSHDDLLAWRPAKKTRGKAAKSKKAAAAPEAASADEPASAAPAKKPAARARKKKAPAAMEASTIDKPEDAPGDPSA